MPERVPTSDDAARPRVRSIITTILVIMISVMIVRDILVRRWSTVTPPASGMTGRFRA